METIETMEEHQALADNSLHTLAVLENTYARMSGTEAKSVMRKLASKNGGEDTVAAKKAQSHSNTLSGNRDSIYLDNLPDYVQQTIMTLVNNINQK